MRLHSLREMQPRGPSLTPTTENMNRLQSSKASSHQLSSSFELPLAFAPQTTKSTKVAARRRDRATAPHYALFAPLHYERGYAYPLLLWLHDDGGSERELRQLMPHVSVRNYVAAAVRGVGGESGRHGYAWDHCPDSTCEAAERVTECVKAAKRRFNVHADRVFIAGQGSGGTMALRLALRYSEMFAGVISIGGAMPRRNAPLNRVNEARNLPILLASSRDSEFYPQADVMSDLRLLHSAGFSLALRQYPGDDELTTAMLSDMDRWMMERISTSAATVS
jgi:phospholipase/carboxylesterase